MVELSLRKGAQTNERKNKHMTFDDRLEIQECLRHSKQLQNALAKILPQHLRLKKHALDLFTFSYPSQLASALGIDYTAHENVIQSSALLK